MKNLHLTITGLAAIALLGLLATAGSSMADTWVPEATPYSPTVNGGLSFAIDGLNNLGLTFKDADTGGLYYAYRSGGSWSAEAVDSGTHTGRASSLAYDGSTPHIVYRDSDDTVSDAGSLAYATRSGGSWTFSTIDAAANTNPRHTSIKIDNEGKPAVGWVDQHELGTSDDTVDYAYYTGTSWQMQQIASRPRVLAGTDLALDGSNTDAQIVYSDGSGWYQVPVWGERQENGTWALDEGLGGNASDTQAGYMAMDLDQNGNPAIGYLYTGTGDVQYATYDGTDWSIETVYSGEARDAFADYRYLDIAIDSWGYTHLAYYDAHTSQLTYSYRADDTWFTSQTWDTKAYWMDLELDSNNTPYIAYYDDTADRAYFIEGEPVPEPATVALFAVGLIAAAVRLRRRQTPA
ncbi:MAG: PEP-CTERM sorting domain-containing protein [Armatimonadota bacterium]